MIFSLLSSTDIDLVKGEFIIQASFAETKASASPELLFTSLSSDYDATYDYDYDLSYEACEFEMFIRGSEKDDDEL